MRQKKLHSEKPRSESTLRATQAEGIGSREVFLEPFNEYAHRPLPALLHQDGTSLSRLVSLVQRLLSPGGCPWDRKQSFESLRKYVLEEAYEVIDAIDSKNRDALKEELGDLLLQIVFQSELARNEGSFAIDDVIETIVSKLVARHPHVFGPKEDELSSLSEEQVLANWEKMKAKERLEKKARNSEKKGDQVPSDVHETGILSSLPRSLPALTRAQRASEKVARVGFDWRDAASCFVKVEEEWRELKEAVAQNQALSIEDEFGDLLFSLANYGRHLGLDAESALHSAIRKFQTRFEHVERCVDKEYGGFYAQKTPLNMEQLDKYWDQAKRGENARSQKNEKLGETSR